MPTIALITASPRDEDSESIALADAIVDAATEADSSIEVDRWDLFEDGALPAFGTAQAKEKMDVIGGEELDAAREGAWGEVLDTADRLKAADILVFAVPMWNQAIPWTLKKLIDVVSQPGVTFDVDPDEGYQGLLGPRRAAVVYTSQLWYPGAPEKFGLDFQASYMRWWLKDLVGVEIAGEVLLQPTDASDDGLPERRRQAQEEAAALGRRLAEPA